MPKHLFIYTEEPELKKLYENGRKNYSDDSGVDLFCPKEIKVYKNSKEIIDFNIKCEMIEYDENQYTVDEVCMLTNFDNRFKTVAYMLFPRSSISKTPLMQANSIGLIDKNYRGCPKSYVRHSEPWVEDEFYQIDKHQRLFQFVAFDGEPFTYSLVKSFEELSKTARGQGGFGSTNK
jgi:dUTP pyrophosphatase